MKTVRFANQSAMWSHHLKKIRLAEMCLETSTDSSTVWSVFDAQLDTHIFFLKNFRNNENCVFLIKFSIC